MLCKNCRKEIGTQKECSFCGYSPEIDGKVFFKGKKGIRPGAFVEVCITEELDGDLLGEAK